MSTFFQDLQRVEVSRLLGTDTAPRLCSAFVEWFKRAEALQFFVLFEFSKHTSSTLTSRMKQAAKNDLANPL